MIFRKDICISIVIPDDATDREQFAATELQSYLHKIFATTYPIYAAHEAPKGPMFLIGCPKFLEQPLINTIDKKNNTNFFIKSPFII